MKKSAKSTAHTGCKLHKAVIRVRVSNSAQSNKTCVCVCRQKLQAKSSAIKFPKGFCDSVAEITEGFSFAYMKEIFVSSLLHIAGHQEEKEKYAENGLESSFLWNVVQQQIKVLRAEMASLEEEESEAKKKEEKKLAKKSLVKKVLERATSGNLEVDSSEDDDDDDGCA